MLNQDAVTNEVQTQLETALRNIKRIRDIINHPSINLNLKINMLNVKVGNQIHASDVDRRIISFPKPDTSDKKVHWNMCNPKTNSYKTAVTLDATNILLQ